MDKEKAYVFVRKYIDILIKKKYNIKNAYIFGSYAKNNYNKDSDIDLALIIYDLKDSFALDIELIKLTKDFNYIIEPHSFDVKDFNINNPVAYEIMNAGIKIM